MQKVATANAFIMDIYTSFFSVCPHITPENLFPSEQPYVVLVFSHIESGFHLLCFASSLIQNMNERNSI